MAGFDARGKVNRALLVGVSEYDLTEPPHGVPGDLPAVRRNLDRLTEVLRRGGVFGEDEITALSSPSLDEFSRALRTAAGEAEGVLLLYFAGHGAIPSAGDELFLQMRNASVIAGGHAVFPGAEMFTTVLTVLATGPAERIVVILDCCFAGNAAWLWETFRDKRRVLLLMSVQANHRIQAGDPRTPTPFTEELVGLLDRDGPVWFRDLADRLRRRMSEGYRTDRGERWQPQSRTEPGEDVLLSARAPADPVPRDLPDPRNLPDPSIPPQPSQPSRPSRPSQPSRPWRPSQPSRPPGPPGPYRRARNALLSLLALLYGRVKAVVARLRRPRPPHPGRPGAGARHVTARLLVLLLVAVLGLGSYGLYTLVGDHGSCAPPVELRVLTDPDLEPTVRAAADAYLTSEENTVDGCRRSGLTVYGAGSADAVTALRRQTAAWQEPPGDETNPQRDVGPQPDIWIPATPADAGRVTAGQDTDAVAALEPDEEPFAYSPVVLAVPQNLAAEELDDRVGAPLNRMIDDLTERAENAAVRRPDPEYADTGLLATIGLYGGADGPTRAEDRVAQTGPPAPTAAELLCALPDDGAVDERTAALVPEFLMRSGVGCDSARRVRRYAQYPGDVPGLEPVFVRVRWQGADHDEQERDAAVGAFRAWLTGERGRAVLAAAGFRDAEGDHALMDEGEAAEGVLRDPDPLIEAAGRKAMDDALDGYRHAHGPGQVLFLLDNSGSMGRQWKGPSGGPGLLKQSLGGLGTRDEYGVWAVSGTAGSPYQELLRFDSRYGRKEAERVLDDRAQVRDAEADPHAALLDALDFMADRGGTGDRPQLIVFITDDEDDERLTGADLTDVLARARTAKVPVAMVSLAGGGCDQGEPDARISEASGGRCLDAGDDLGAALHDEVARTGTGEE
ncbi:hypothetical protein GCM10010129_37960 [Streptomyces fumigatiscleroticus]|nr:hypothetical protein GCM10010129_37960 [Streptomyces fumigatiscleroticus]